MNETSKTVWLIESKFHNYVGSSYNEYNETIFDWTADSLKAIRFARSEDAQSVIDILEFLTDCGPQNVLGPTEHIFYETD